LEVYRRRGQLPIGTIGAGIYCNSITVPYLALFLVCLPIYINSSFYRSLPIAPEQMRGTIERLRVYRAKGEYELGHEYICNLGQRFQDDKLVTIEVVQLYLVQGHYIRALAACEKARVPLLDQELEEYPSEVLDEDSVCLELLHAYVNILRNSQLYTALRKAMLVGKLWLGEDSKFCKLFLSQIPHTNPDIITN
jgi:hypothetical protein